MAQHLNPWSSRQFLDANHVPLVGAKLFSYVSSATGTGGTTKQTLTQDAAGNTNHTNPMILNARGEPSDSPSGASMEMWQPSGVFVKLVLAPSTDTDPPTSIISTWDNLSGINDTTTTIDQWISGPAPTFVSTVQFTLVGDQTTEFHVGRRLKTTNTAGTIYSTITVSAFTSLTTITVVNDSGVLDSGLSAVFYGILTSDNHSVPEGAAINWTGTHSFAGNVDFTGDIDVNGSELNDGQAIVAAAGGATVTGWAPKGHISGLTLSNDTDTDHDINITAGEVTDSTDAYVLKLTSEITKQIDAIWAVGDDAGGLFTGTVAIDTWYHLFLIRKDSDGSIDAGFDTSVTAANIPAGYTAFRRIGSVLTDGSSNILPFNQHGDYFWWDVLPSDVSVSPPTSATSYAMSVPPDINVIGIMEWTWANTTAGFTGYWGRIYSTLETDVAAGPANSNIWSQALNSTERKASGRVHVLTDTSKQIRVDTTSATGTLKIGTAGYIDARGK